MLIKVTLGLQALSNYDDEGKYLLTEIDVTLTYLLEYGKSNQKP